MNFRKTFIAYLLLALAPYAGGAFGAEASPPSVAVANEQGTPPSTMVSLAPENRVQPAPTAEAAEPPQPSVQEQSAKAAAVERTQAWKRALEELLPNSPSDIREYHEKSVEEAKAAAPRVAPMEALSQAIPVSLQPGGRSPKLRILHGFVMAIEVLDNSGQPWPITSAHTGDKDAFEVVIAGSENGAAIATDGDRGSGTQAPRGVVKQGDGQGNVVTITALKRFQPSNLILILQGESRPISVILVPTEATEKIDLEDRVTLLVDGNGPLAKPQAVASYDRLDVGDDLRRALVGSEPKDGASEILTTLPPGMRAWADGTTLWLRTPEQVISPAPQAAVSMGNMRAYRLPYLPTIVLLNDGHLLPVEIRGAKATKQGVL